jgi:2,4-dienoyl-CoA reductase (NADPH2)
VEYVKVDDAGLHTRVHGESKVFDVDTVIVCAGQLPRRDVYEQLRTQGVYATVIGGAFEAGELDAKRAINQASRLAAVV